MNLGVISTLIAILATWVLAMLGCEVRSWEFADVLPIMAAISVAAIILIFLKWDYL